jgi:hypothetical protein
MSGPSIATPLAGARPVRVERDQQRPLLRTTDNTAVSIAFKETGGSIDYRHTVLPGETARIGVTAEAYNAEGQLISGTLTNPVPLAFIGTAVTVNPTTMTTGTMRLTISGTAASTNSPTAWGVTESRGGSSPVPYDVLTTGFGNCTSAVPPMGADTRGCLTVAPLILAASGAFGPNLSAPLNIAGQLGSALFTEQEGQQFSLSVFEARTGSADEPEVGETFFSFVPTMYDKGACTPTLGTVSSAGAWPKWTAHGYFFATPAIWYWTYGEANCVDPNGNNLYPPSGLSDVLDVGPNGARLPYGFSIYADSTHGARDVKQSIELSDGHVKQTIAVTVTE